MVWPEVYSRAVGNVDNGGRFWKRCRENTDFESGVRFIQGFLSDRYDPCKYVSCTTVQQYNRKIRAADQRITGLLDDAIYSTCWVCKHFGEFKPRSTDDKSTTGKSRNHCHYKRGSEFFIYLAWEKSAGLYTVKSANLHHSHDVRPELYHIYISNR